MDGKSWTVNSIDLGLVPGTSIAGESHLFSSWIWSFLLPSLLWLVRLFMGTDNVHTVDQAAQNLAWIGLGREAQGITGKYFEGRKLAMSSLDSLDHAKQEDLWFWTLAEIANDEAEKREFNP
jgi:hypothetical protein